MSYNIYLGNNIVDNIYLGNTEITEADLLGSLLNLLKSTTKAKFLFLWTGKFDGNNLLSDLDSSVITVTGKDFASSYIPSTSAATFAIPDNVTYKTADEDVFWHTGATILQKTTAQLVAYDYTRTLIKYSDGAPHNIQAIGILKSGEVLNASEIDEVHKYFKLWILWSGILNANGYIKENRVINSIPLFSTGQVTKADPTKVAITFDQNLLESSVPDVSAFALAGKTITGVTIVGAVVTLTVSVAYSYGDTGITVAYTQPIANNLKALVGGTKVASFTGGTITNNSLYPAIAEYKAVWEAMPTKPNLTDFTRQNTMLKALVDGGYFTKMVHAFMPSTHTGGANINWKTPGTNDPLPVNSPTFEEYGGYTGATTGTKYVRSNFIPSVNGGEMSISNFCAIVGIGTDLGESSSIRDFGVFDGNTAFRILCRQTGTPDIMGFWPNFDGALTATNTNSIGHYMMTRNNTSTFIYGKNKSNSAATAANNAAEALVTKEIYYCGFNNNGNPVPNNKNCRYAFLFTYLTTTETDAVIDIMEAYLDNYGKGLM